MSFWNNSYSRLENKWIVNHSEVTLIQRGDQLFSQVCSGNETTDYEIPLRRLDNQDTQAVIQRTAQDLFSKYSTSSSRS